MFGKKIRHETLALPISSQSEKEKDERYLNRPIHSGVMPCTSMSLSDNRCEKRREMNDSEALGLEKDDGAVEAKSSK